MLKTNSKKAIENTKNYIVENFDGCEDYGLERPETFPEIAKVILDIFRQEKRYEHFRGSEQELFRDWTQGLPHILYCGYYLHSAVEDLGKILEETQEERERYSEEQAEKLLTNLIYRELTKAVK